VPADVQPAHCTEWCQVIGHWVPPLVCAVGHMLRTGQAGCTECPVCNEGAFQLQAPALSASAVCMHVSALLHSLCHSMNVALRPVVARMCPMQRLVSLDTGQWAPLYVSLSLP
jgi:hypothetical protein